jgi:hypothetical protein
MTITVQFSRYNDRRYSRPWIAKVTAWPVGGRATLAWGTYLGDDGGGEAEIAANPGDVIRYGQKDVRKPSGSTAQWAIVNTTGEPIDCTEAEAAKAYRRKASPPPEPQIV